MNYIKAEIETIQKNNKSRLSRIGYKRVIQRIVWAGKLQRNGRQLLRHFSCDLQKGYTFDYLKNTKKQTSSTLQCYFGTNDNSDEVSYLFGLLLSYRFHMD